jgi:hypothetical protein
MNHHGVKSSAGIRRDARLFPDNLERIQSKPAICSMKIARGAGLDHVRTRFFLGQIHSGTYVDNIIKKSHVPRSPT